MSVHYKFKSAVEYDTLPVDGVSISLEDLKEAIIQQKRLGRGQPYDLQITNAETKEVYTNDKTLIPKNSSLIVARVPIDPAQMKKPWDSKESTALLLSNPSNLMNTEDAAEAAQVDRKIKELTDLTRMDGSEDDKINAMVAQSTMAYHPSKYVKLRVSKMMGAVPLDYKCYKCHQSGHWVSMCPLNHQDLRKSTGIPSKFLVEVSDPSIPGVMINSSGKFVRLLDMDVASQEKVQPPPDRPPPPQEIVCLLCKELLRDAVLIPCCAAAFCDDCIRSHLVDSEETRCPTCHEEGISPDTLIPNRYLRIKTKAYTRGWLGTEKRPEKPASEPLSSLPPYMVNLSTPTPPRSPVRSASPATSTSLAEQTQPPSAQQPGTPRAVSPDNLKENGNVDSDKENTVLEPAGNFVEEPIESSREPEELVEAQKETEKEGIEEGMPYPAEAEELIQEQEEQQQPLPQLEPIVSEVIAEVDVKQRKGKKKKKRKASRHESEEERDGKEGRRKKDRRHSHKSQEGKNSSSGSGDKELLHDVPPPLDTEAKAGGVEGGAMEVKDAWGSEKIQQESRRSRSRSRSRSRTRSRSRSRSIDRDRDRSRDRRDEVLPGNRYDVLQFDPRVPPPTTFIQSPPKDPFYQVPPFVSTAPVSLTVPMAPGTTSQYPIYTPGVPPPSYIKPPGVYPTPHVMPYEAIDDPLTLFNKHLQEKDEQRARRARKSRSRSPHSRSPLHRYHPRGRSSRRSWTRSRSRSLSRSPSPSQRIKSPLQVRPLPPRSPGRPHLEYGAPRDFDRFAPSAHPGEEYSSYPPPGASWDPHSWYGQSSHKNFHGDFSDGQGRGNRGQRGRDRAGVRQDNFGYDQHSQDGRYPYDRPQPLVEPQRGLMGTAPHWERDSFDYDKDKPWMDRGARLPLEPERRYYGEMHNSPWEFDDPRGRRDCMDNLRRHGEGPGRKGLEDEWSRYPDMERKKFEEEEARRRNFRGHGDFDDPGRPDSDHFDDFKRFPQRKDDGRRDEGLRKDPDSRMPHRKDAMEGRLGRHDGKRLDEWDVKFKGSSRHRELQEESAPYRCKSHDSPSKSFKGSPMRDRKDKDPDRREKDMEKREKDGDRREKDADRREKDGEKESDRREKDAERREKDGDRRDKFGDRREKDVEKREKEMERSRDKDGKERDFDRKEAHKRDREGGDGRGKDSYRRERDTGDRKDKDSDRKSRDVDRRDRDAEKRDRDSDRRERDSQKRERDHERREKGDDGRKEREGRRERDGERSRTSRWERADAKVEREKEVEKARSDRLKDGVQGKEEGGKGIEKEEKRKARQKEERLEGPSHKTSGRDTKEDDGKLEKRKHERKKKKKEKRRASQASTELSQAELSGDEVEDKKRRKKKEKKKKVKGQHGNDTKKDTEETPKPPEDTTTRQMDTEPSDVPFTQEPEPSELAAQNPNLALSEPEAAESNTTPEKTFPPVPLPQLSKWERDEDVSHSPSSTAAENTEPEEERKVTVDILKRAENALFFGRGLVSRKVFLDAQKQRDDERSPTPDWDRSELREAKRRGPSIQITISSKTESQIGRPRSGRAELSSPERQEERKVVSRLRIVPEEPKPERNAKDEKELSSISNVDVTKSRKKSEEDAPHPEPERDVTSEPQPAAEDNPTPSAPEDPVKADTEPKENIEGPVSAESLESVSTEGEPKGLKRELSSEEFIESKRLKGDKEVTPADSEEPTTTETSVRPTDQDVNEVNNVSLDNEGESLTAEPEPDDALKTTPALSASLPQPSTEDSVEPATADTVVPEETTEERQSVVVDVMQIPEVERMVVREAPILYPLPQCDASREEERVEEQVKEVEERVEGGKDMEVEDTEEQEAKKRRYSPIRVPSPATSKSSKETKGKEKIRKRKKRKKSLSISSSNSSSSSSSSSSTSSTSSSSEDEEIVRKKRRKKKKKKRVMNSDSSDTEAKSKHKKRKKEKEKKKKKKKEKRKKADKQK